MSDQGRICSNCNVLFPAHCIDPHQAYCTRNIHKCKSCDEMVDINLQQQHDKQFHEKRQCPQCKEMIAAQVFTLHDDVCTHKPKYCQYCQLQWAQAEFTRHQQSCASRTKVCIQCQKNVQLRQFDEHTRRCERRREVRNDTSQEPYRHNRNQRQRQNSSNNIREPVQRQTSVNRIPRPHTIKPSNIIGPEIIKPVYDPVPICVRLALKAKEQQRPPLKSKN